MVTVMGGLIEKGVVMPSRRSGPTHVWFSQLFWALKGKAEIFSSSVRTLSTCSEQLELWDHGIKIRTNQGEIFYLP